MELSIILPSIRTHLLPRFLQSVEIACMEHDWEVIIVGPFEVPEELMEKYKGRIQSIHSYSTVPVCIQLATQLARGTLVCHAVDDSTFYAKALDDAIEYYWDIQATSPERIHLVGLTYIENTNSMTTQARWSVKNLPEFNLKSIDQDWLTCVQPLMMRADFMSMGGFDCSFEYSNHSHHDFMFRWQMEDRDIYIVPFTVSRADHMPERSGDHAPIHDAQTGPDLEKFSKKWDTDSVPQSIIDYGKQFNYGDRWQRRFDKNYKSYEEMMK